MWDYALIGITWVRNSSLLRAAGKEAPSEASGPECWPESYAYVKDSESDRDPNTPT